MQKTRWLATAGAFLYSGTLLLGCAPQAQYSFPPGGRSPSRTASSLIPPQDPALTEKSAAEPPGSLSADGRLCYLSSTNSLGDFTQYARSINQITDKGIVRSDFPVLVNDAVRENIKYLLERRTFMNNALSRSGRYVPLMQDIFRKNGLPEDLVYLSLVESGFNPHAYSRAKASGPWQFIEETGRRYGLRIDAWADERRDPEKATRAAAGYLKDLYAMFGDWNLAVASYNAGEQKVLNVVQRYNTGDFWELRKKSCLREETCEFVPRLMAAILIAKQPQEYGFGDVVLQEPIPMTTVTIPNPTDVKFIAEVAEMSTDEVKECNPELRKGYTPARPGGYSLKIPKAKERLFTANFERNKSKFLAASAFHKHRVKPGETLYKIAQQYNLKVAQIQKANGITNPKLIHPGKVLIIPVRSAITSS